MKALIIAELHRYRWGMWLGFSFFFSQPFNMEREALQYGYFLFWFCPLLDLISDIGLAPKPHRGGPLPLPLKTVAFLSYLHFFLGLTQMFLTPLLLYAIFGWSTYHAIGFFHGYLAGLSVACLSLGIKAGIGRGNLIIFAVLLAPAYLTWQEPGRWNEIGWLSLCLAASLFLCFWTYLKWFGKFASIWKRPKILRPLTTLLRNMSLRFRRYRWKCAKILRPLTTLLQSTSSRFKRNRWNRYMGKKPWPLVTLYQKEFRFLLHLGCLALFIIVMLFIKTNEPKSGIANWAMLSFWAGSLCNMTSKRTLDDRSLVHLPISRFQIVRTWFAMYLTWFISGWFLAITLFRIPIMEITPLMLLVTIQTLTIMYAKERFSGTRAHSGMWMVISVGLAWILAPKNFGVPTWPEISPITGSPWILWVLIPLTLFAWHRYGSLPWPATWKRPTEEEAIAGDF
ncbi:hypothetical protein SCOR_31780 [Sulfidibacter corallicola]|uniref:Uncharacterized protein n=1 Tax=Sulfidibacter corallicola TaxID=2818388 RepID=A0A8A4TJZ6_SULCO|nr:hypothetical protein [Sulfidibacter corallicola]QTD49870.1 hypothetical protein J3U87_30175 [Sulfidibacter corallicola]